MIRMIGKRRVQHPNDSLLALQPLRHRNCGHFMLSQPLREGSEPAQDQPGIIAGHTKPKTAHRAPDSGPKFVGNYDRAHQHVGVTAPVLGQRNNRHVDTMLERMKVQRAAPRVVNHRKCAVLARRCSKARNVLNLEGITSRALEVDDARLRPHQLRQVRRTDSRIIKRDLDPGARQLPLGQGPPRAVNTVGHQHMISARRKGHDRQCDRGQP